MPYHIRRSKRGGRTIYLIVRNQDGKVVGRSKTERAARASIRIRMSADRNGG